MARIGPVIFQVENGTRKSYVFQNNFVVQCKTSTYASDLCLQPRDGCIPEGMNGCSFKHHRV
jgi:hypothetical protein